VTLYVVAQVVKLDF